MKRKIRPADVFSIKIETTIGPISGANLDSLKVCVKCLNLLYFERLKMLHEAINKRQTQRSASRRLHHFNQPKTRANKQRQKAGPEHCVP